MRKCKLNRISPLYEVKFQIGWKTKQEKNMVHYSYRRIMIKLSFKPTDGLHLAFKNQGQPIISFVEIVAGAKSPVLTDGNELKAHQHTAYKNTG